ncbi:hypothetical protein BJ508DRAFT_325554 [Ascobolus immersus RN42]|uniref:Uncharacterized protein n=1 Tax=Ascobolus immersus RN42 TaxID=1160509 RepID=A0A3N4IKZ1_ASCIM|nr:hypothetical protein BJ508DRAFT_325554 [Ascobolus immersus RN42]
MDRIDLPMPERMAIMHAEMPPGPEKDDFGKVVKENLAQFEKYKKENPDIFPDQVAYSRLSLNEKRLRFLEMDSKLLNRDKADQENYEAVRLAYVSGKLNLAKRQPGQAAIFFGGEFKQGWGALFDRMWKNSVVQWKKETPSGRLWVEEGALNWSSTQ